MSTLAMLLRERVEGEVFDPDGAGFDAAHTGFNLAVRHRPDAVVVARHTRDVSEAVRCAADRGVTVRVQSTGHGVGSAMNGGILINTARMQGLRVDPRERTATASAGVRWQQAIEGAAPHGLATLCGSSPTVGIVGYTLGGGMGPMARTFGFASDRVRRMQMVDATGRVIEVTPEAEPELFWALRGGKPDIGVVTEITFELLPVPHYFGGAIFFAGEDTEPVMRAFAHWAPSLPESVSTSIALLRLPDLPSIPEPVRGKLSVQLRYVHIGDPTEGAELLAPMRAAATPLIDLVDVTPSEAIASVHQDPTEPVPARDEGMVLNGFDDAAVDSLLSVAGPGVDLPLLLVEVRLMGGALARPGAQGSAVGGRQGRFNACVIGMYTPSLAEAVEEGTRNVMQSLRPWWASGGSLINFQGAATDPDQVRLAWDYNTRDRLDGVKRIWDPSGVFHFSYSPS